MSKPAKYFFIELIFTFVLIFGAVGLANASNDQDAVLEQLTQINKDVSFILSSLPEQCGCDNCGFFEYFFFLLAGLIVGFFANWLYSNKISKNTNETPP